MQSRYGIILPHHPPPAPVVDGALRDLYRHERGRERERWRHVRDPRFERPALHATIGRVQTAKGGDGSGSSVASVQTANFGSSVTSGNLSVVIARCANQSMSTVTDTLGTTYTKRSEDTSHDPAMSIWDGVLGSSGTNKITATASSAAPYFWAFAIEISGATATPFDTSGVRAATAATDCVSTAFSTAQAIEYVVMGCSQNAFNTYLAGTDSASHVWTLIDGSIGGSGNNFGGAEEYVTAAQFSSVTAHITASGSNQYTTVWAAYKDSGAGGGSTFGPIVDGGPIVTGGVIRGGRILHAPVALRKAA